MKVWLPMTVICVPFFANGTRALGSSKDARVYRWGEFNWRGLHPCGCVEIILHAWWRLSSVASFRSPRLLSATPHLCSSNKPSKLTGSPVWWSLVDLYFTWLLGVYEERIELFTSPWGENAHNKWSEIYLHMYIYIYLKKPLRTSHLKVAEDMC